MPPQGPPGPQPQPAALAATAATPAAAPSPVTAPAATAATTKDQGQGQREAADGGAGGDAAQAGGTLATAATLNNNCSNSSNRNGHDHSVLRRRQPFHEDAVEEDGAQLKAPAACGNGCAQAAQGKPRSLDEDEDGKPKLLSFHDVPQHLQFNPYIVTGYRPMSNFWGSLRSLFYLHNETVNIVTHGVPIVYILLVVPGLVPWGRLDHLGLLGRFLAWCHLVGAVSPWVGSFVYHLFMNLQAGERVYNRLLRLDMFGIWICQSFGALPMVTATVYCLPWSVRWFVISSYSILSLCGLYKAMTAWSPWDRRLSFALPWASRLVLCAVRAVLGGGSPHNMLHLILQDGVSLVGGVVGAVYFPEKYFPGWVDYCLNSHNIMHILTVAAVYSMHCATIQDLEWIASVDCKPAGPQWGSLGLGVLGGMAAVNGSGSDVAEL